MNPPIRCLWSMFASHDSLAQHSVHFHSVHFHFKAMLKTEQRRTFFGHKNHNKLCLLLFLVLTLHCNKSVSSLRLHLTHSIYTWFALHIFCLLQMHIKLNQSVNTKFLFNILCNVYLFDWIIILISCVDLVV